MSRAHSHSGGGDHEHYRRDAAADAGAIPLTPSSGPWVFPCLCGADLARGACGFRPGYHPSFPYACCAIPDRRACARGHIRCVAGAADESGAADPHRERAVASQAWDRRRSAGPFYSLMPALESANEREFRDGASLAAISRAGGPLTESERSQVLSAVETLRRDNAEIVRFSLLAESAMKQLGVNIGDYRPFAGRVSSLQDPQRVINEVQAMPMAQQCVNDVKALLADRRQTR